MPGDFLAAHLGVGADTEVFFIEQGSAARVAEVPHAPKCGPGSSAERSMSQPGGKAIQEEDLTLPGVGHVVLRSTVSLEASAAGG